MVSQEALDKEFCHKRSAPYNRRVWILMHQGLKGTMNFCIEHRGDKMVFAFKTKKDADIASKLYHALVD